MDQPAQNMKRVWQQQKWYKNPKVLEAKQLIKSTGLEDRDKRLKGKIAKQKGKKNIF